MAAHRPENTGAEGVPQGNPPPKAHSQPNTEKEKEDIKGGKRERTQREKTEKKQKRQKRKRKQNR